MFYLFIEMTHTAILFRAVKHLLTTAVTFGTVANFISILTFAIVSPGPEQSDVSVLELQMQPTTDAVLRQFYQKT